MKKINHYHHLPGNSALSLTMRGEQAELHIWAGPFLDQSDVLTGAGFYSVMSAVKAIVEKSGAKELLIVACDERRQRVFDRYAKKCGLKQTAGVDPDGDDCLVWVF